MKNFIQKGATLPLIAPAGGVVSGQLVLVGAIAGVASGDAAAGAAVEVAVEGVYELAKTPGDAFTQGQVAKVITATGVIGAAGTVLVGWVVQAAAAGTTTARVRLVPGL